MSHGLSVTFLKPKVLNCKILPTAPSGLPPPPWVVVKGWGLRSGHCWFPISCSLGRRSSLHLEENFSLSPSPSLPGFSFSLWLPPPPCLLSLLMPVSPPSPDAHRLVCGGTVWGLLATCSPSVTTRRARVWLTRTLRLAEQRSRKQSQVHPWGHL